MKKRKVAFIYSTASISSYLFELGQKLMPSYEILNFVDESILLAQNSVVRREKVKNLIISARSAGVSSILITCSTIGDLAKNFSEIYRIPIFRIDSPMAQVAVESGQKIAVLFTNPKTLQSTSSLFNGILARKKGNNVKIRYVFVDNAMKALSQGNIKGHDKFVEKSIMHAAKWADVIALAQVTTAVALSRRKTVLKGKIILTSPISGIQQIDALLYAPLQSSSINVSF